MEQLQLNDFLNYKFLSGVQYAPGGQKAAFVVSVCNEEENNYESRLYLYDGEIRQLTDLGKERGFLWLDDNRILFSSVRSAKEKKRAEAKEAFTSYYVLDLRGGEAMPYFTLPFAAQKMEKLDDTRFMVLGGIDADRPDYYQMTEEERGKVHKAYADEKDYEVFEEIPFWFNGGGVRNKRRTALFLVENGETLTVKRMTEPFAMVHSTCVVGDEILFDVDTFEAKPHRGSCCVKALNWKTGEVRDVFQSDRQDVSQLIKVGGKVWMLGTTAERHGMNENDWVYTLDPVSGEVSVLRREEYSLYGSVGSDCRYGGGQSRAAKGDSLYTITTREGSSLICRIDQDGSAAFVLEKEGSVDCLTLNENADKALLIGLYDMKLQELYSCDLATGELTQLSHFNDAVLADKYVAQPEYLTVESEGLTIGGWVLKPRDYDPSKTYPAVLDIHGGPKTVYGPVFYHEMQLWANMGYFVFYCNPKGSDGRDNQFMDIRGHYGETDYQNLMDFTDAVLKAYPQIDANRVCETGGSYGGFMTNWVIGHTDRFAAAVSVVSISNYFTKPVGDIGWYDMTEQRADAWHNAGELWWHSPLKYAKNVKTPTMFCQNDEDFRCPIDQAEQMYSALVHLGVETRMIVYKGASHGGMKPSQKVHRMKETLAWFGKYLRK